MELTIYDIIKGPVVTDKAYKANQKLQQLVINVHMASNKPLVKEALEKLFNVKVDKIRISIRKPKLRMNRRQVVKGSFQKKAIVTLKEGYTLDMFGQTEVRTENKEGGKS